MEETEAVDAPRDNDAARDYSVQRPKSRESFIAMKKLMVFTKWGWRRSLYITVFLGFAAAFESGTYLSAYPAMQEDIGFSNLEFSFLLVTMRVLTLIYAPGLMWWGTYHPPFRIICYMYIISCFGNLFVAFSTQYWMVILAMIPKIATWATDNLFASILDIYGDPKHRIWWVNIFLIVQAIGVFFGIIMAVYVPWRIVHFVNIVVMIPFAIVCYLIDGPLILPRKDEHLEADGDILKHIRTVCTIPRVIATYFMINVLFAVIFGQVDFYIKYTRDEFNWDEEMVTLTMGPIFIFGGIFGKYMGAYVLDKRKNRIGLGEENPELRNALYVSTAASGVALFLFQTIVNMSGWFFGVVGFLLTGGVNSLTQSFFPELNFQMWSSSMDLVPIVLPFSRYAYVLLYTLVVLMIGGLKDQGLSYPQTFAMTGLFGWFSVILFAIVAYTDIIGADYDKKLTTPAEKNYDAEIEIDVEIEEYRSSSTNPESQIAHEF